MDRLDLIRRDLQAFADAGSEVLVNEDGAVLERLGKPLELKFIKGSSEFPDILFSGARTSFAGFLSSPAVADLQQLARTTAKVQKRDFGRFIETAAHIDSGAQQVEASRPAKDLLAHESGDLPYLSTKLVFVRGEAGSGKTVVLRRLAFDRAVEFIESPGLPLFLYVNVQGRALSSLDEAIAKELDDLDAQFRYRAIDSLTRHDLLVPIIDGFDELLGSGGYEEAFSSLASFLARLEGRGSIIASARTTFFEYRDFRRNAERYSEQTALNYRTTTVSIEPWDETLIRQYFEADLLEAGRSRNEANQLFEGLWNSLDDQSQLMLSKPFYASKTADLLASGIEFNVSSSLLDQLVSAFLEREAQKVVDKDKRPILDTSGHRAFLAAIAEEMWWQEGRALDIPTVQAVAELLADERGLPPAGARSLVEKVSSYAFLSLPHGQKRLLSFEHEVLYGYFLAEKLRILLREGGADLRRFLGRSVFEDTLTEQAAIPFTNDSSFAAAAIGRIGDALRPTLSEVVARENAGMLIAELLRGGKSHLGPFQIKNAIFNNEGLSTTKLKGVEFYNCILDNVDITDSIWEEIKFKNVTIRTLKVSPNTVLEASLEPGVDIFSLYLRSGDSLEGPIFDPSRLTSILKGIGVEIKGDQAGPAALTERGSRLTSLLTRFLKRADTRFYFSKDDDDMRSIVEDSVWADLEDLLRRSGIVQDKYITRSGGSKAAAPLLRLVVPPATMRRGENPADVSLPESVLLFWQELRRV